jgi:hypothetical protein
MLFPPSRLSILFFAGTFLTASEVDLSSSPFVCFLHVSYYNLSVVQLIPLDRAISDLSTSLLPDTEGHLLVSLEAETSRSHRQFGRVDKVY